MRNVIVQAVCTQNDCRRIVFTQSALCAHYKFTDVKGNDATKLCPPAL